MIKKGQIGDQIDDHNIGATSLHPEASRGADLTQSEQLAPGGAVQMKWEPSDLPPPKNKKRSE
jgi:hypothetical protein